MPVKRLLHRLVRAIVHLAPSGGLGSLARRWLQRWRAPASAQREGQAFPPPGRGEAATVPEQTPEQPARSGAADPAEEAPRLLPAAAEEGFLEGEHAGAAGRCRYRLYCPPGRFAGKARPLLVMLHGCKQDAEDFAAGTGMNEVAREHGFYVLYPEQSRSANPLGCWNWFQPQHQQRGQGEPALLAEMTRTVIAQYGLDSRRVYLAGLSAGGSMASVLARTYPELFAALGVHSGLPCGAAHSMASAFTVMREGQPSPYAPISRMRPDLSAPRIPTIVFHGDEDDTVHPRNGQRLVELALGPPALARAETGIAPQGRRYTRTCWHEPCGRLVAEHWTVHGGAHAWFGGKACGSYTDAQGPDAAREFWRFFSRQVRPAPA